MQALVRRLAVAGLGAAFCLGLSTSGAAAEPGASCKSLTHVQRRVVEKADQGVDALRQYIFITRGIHQLDMMEVAGKLDAWRAEARCAEAAGSDSERTARAAF